MQRSAVRSIAWLGLRGRIIDNRPSKLLLEVAKARLANPVIIIGRSITLVQNVWSILDHELCPAKRTMVVIPFSVHGVAAIGAVNKGHASEIFFLPAESPIGTFCHARGKDLTRMSSAAAGGSERGLK
jgi:hypothetical protein